MGTENNAHVHRRCKIKMDNGWEKVRKEVTCSICLTVFKEPKILPCLHTFCAKCLQILWQQVDTVGVKKIIHCPQCREKVPLSSVEELPASFSVSRLVDIVEMQDRLNKEAPPMCQSCSSNIRAVASCTPCGIFLCAPCLDVHETLKMTSSHQINSLDDIKSGKVTVPSILDHKQEMCSIHPDKPLEMYCKQDKCLICLGCAVVNHRNCQYDFIAQIAKQHKREIENTLPSIKQQLNNIRQAATQVKNMQQQIQLRKEENTNNVNKVFQETVASLKERKQQLLDDINKTTAVRMKALNEQHNELLNLHAQMNGYLELIEIKLKSERDRAIVAMKDQMVNRGSSLLRVVRSARSSPIEAVPPKVEFPRLQNVLDLAKLLGVFIRTEACRLVEITQDPNEPTFQVSVRDSMGQPISNCASLLDVKIISNKDSYDKLDIFKKKCAKDIEVPKITNKGNGIYEFSTTCDNTMRTSAAHTASHYYGGDSYGIVSWSRQKMQQKYGLVCVQLFGKDVPASPLK